MFRDIEKVFKKNDLLSRMLKFFPLVFIFAILLLLLVGNAKINILTLIIIILLLDSIFYMLFIYIFLFIDSHICIKKIMNIKYSTTIIKKHVINTNIELKKKICEVLNIKSKEQLIPIINHYRDYSLKKIVFKFNLSDLIGIVSIALTLVVGIHQINPLDSTTYAKIIACAILLPSLTILLINAGIEDYSILKGKKDIYKRLEEILVEIYLEAKNKEEE